MNGSARSGGPTIRLPQTRPVWLSFEAHTPTPRCRSNSEYTSTDIIWSLRNSDLSLLITHGPSSLQSPKRPCDPANERGVERNDVEQLAEAQLALGELPADGERRHLDRWIEEQLDRVVARLAMDVDRARVVRRARVVQPVVVREPGVGSGDRDRGRPARGWSTPYRAAFSSRPSTRPRRAVACDQRAHLVETRAGRSRRRARPGDRPPRMPRSRPDRRLEALLVAHGDQPALAQRAIDVDGRRHVRDARTPTAR